MVMLAMLVMVANDAPVATAAHESAATAASRPITIARLPLRSLAAARAPIGGCTAEPAEAPRPWTPEKDVIGVAADDCWGQAIVVTAPGRRARLPAVRPLHGNADNGRMRAAMTALPYLRGVVGGGAMTVALTGRLMLARGSVPAMRLDIGHGRVGATSYVTAPEPQGLMLGRPDRF